MLSYLAKMEPLSIVNSTKLAECLGQSKKGYRKDISPTPRKECLDQDSDAMCCV
jgi:hypothetical protein